ncbi:MAG: iron-containing alcohol dehydrogenase [Alphaproteobacteria bacterium]|nr:iron-containing alcohol dehydrogenase [Alphaproteobacteria bacterium]
MIDPTTLRGDWNFPTHMRFGPGRILELAAACSAVGMTRPLLVTDPGLAALPMVGEAIARNETVGLPTGLFSDVAGNPVGRNVDDGAAVYRAGGHDGIIAFGGGSAIDAAKTIALMAGQVRPLWDFEDQGNNWQRIDPSGVAPIVAVPTTAGTGSETGRAAVIIDEDARAKKIVFHPRMMPFEVISDPELTVGLPPDLTAATGMDALAHCLEALCAPSFHPMAEGIALEGARLVHDWLPRAYADGMDLAARAHMLVAASMGSTAFQKGLGAVHSISHPVGAIYGVHHGLANAIVLPYVLRFNRNVIEDKICRLARVLALPEPSFEAAMAWLLDLRETLNIPHSLGAVGVPDDEADRVAAAALVDPTAAGNPVALDEASLKRLFLDCVHGNL